MTTESRDAPTVSAEAGGGIGVPRHSTVIALSYAATALVLVALWGLMVGPTTQLQPFVFTALIAAAFLAERIAVPVSPRTWYTISTPIVLLTGLVGGPIAGSIAGAATAVGDEAGTWRRRAAYGGLNSVQGFAAGLAGMTHLGGSNRSILCASIAAITVLASNIAGRVLIGHVRRIPVKPLARPGNIVDAIEMLVAIPVLALLLQSYDTSGPALMLITIAAMVASLYVVMKTRDRYLARIEEHFADARTDRLTGAPNRRAYDEELERAVARVQRGEHLVALLVFDIDHFKSVNTTYGWTGGDELLRAITGRVGDILRASDHLSRRGGEEFCVIAPGVPDQVALRELAEKVRGIVRMAPFAIVGSSVDVTVSVGATLIDGSLTPTEADGLANAALSRAKDGRDRVVILPEPDAGGDREECGLGSPLRPPQASALSS